MYGFEGQKVRLAPLDKARHFENAVRWLNDPSVTQWTLTGDLPITRLHEDDWFNRMSRPSDTDVVFAIETFDEQHIGLCGIHRIEFRNGVGVTGTLIGRTALWGQGYGTDAVQTRTRYAFEVLGLRMLLSEVLADNVASHRVLLKAGYREVGRVPRRMWKRGEFRDQILLMVERDAWRAAQPDSA